jgi:hypothetical protein
VSTASPTASIPSQSSSKVRGDGDLADRKRALAALDPETGHARESSPVTALQRAPTTMIYTHVLNRGAGAFEARWTRERARSALLSQTILSRYPTGFGVIQGLPSTSRPRNDKPSGPLARLRA